MVRQGLKSCPFCGSDDVEYFSDLENKDEHGFREPAIVCNGCSIEFSFGAFGEGISEEVAENMVKGAWDNRVE